MPTLPFSKAADVRVQDGTSPIVGTMPVSDPWPTSRTVFPAGAHYDHNAEAPLSYADILDGANVTLTIDGTDFKVIDRERHAYLPHVALRLRRSRPGG